jgi:hypothetical protein
LSEGLIIANLILSAKIPLPDQIFPTSYGVGVAIGYHEKGIRHGGDGVIVMVGDNDPVIPAPFPE